MENFEYKIKVAAESKEEAKDTVNAMIGLMKTITHELSRKEFIEFSERIVADPNLIHMAKHFI